VNKDYRKKYLGSDRTIYRVGRMRANAYCGHPLDGSWTMCITGPTTLRCWSQMTVSKSNRTSSTYWSHLSRKRRKAR